MSSPPLPPADHRPAALGTAAPIPVALPARRTAPWAAFPRCSGELPKPAHRDTSRSQFATGKVLAYVEVLCNVLLRALGRHIERPDPAASFSYAHVAIR